MLVESFAFNAFCKSVWFDSVPVIPPHKTVGDVDVTYPISLVHIEIFPDFPLNVSEDVAVIYPGFTNEMIPVALSYEIGKVPEKSPRIVEVVNELPDPHAVVESVPLAFVLKHNPALPNDGT